MSSPADGRERKGGAKLTESCAALIAERFEPSREWARYAEWADASLARREAIILEQWAIFRDRIHAAWGDEFDFPRGATCRYCGAIAPTSSRAECAPPSVKVARLVRRDDHWLCVDCYLRGYDK
jgi:hypothetical protein